MTDERHYPTIDEVNDLLTAADEYQLEDSAEYKRVLYAARGCKAEAVAYADLAKLLDEYRRSDPYAT